MKTATRILIFILALVLIAAPVSAESLKMDMKTPAESMTEKLFTLCNKEREKNGLPKLVWSDELAAVAKTRAEELTEQYSHTRPNGEEWYTAAKEAGLKFSRASENIARGTVTAEKVMEAWMNNEGHKKNILSDNTHFASFVMLCPESDGDYQRYVYIQMFMRPKKK